MVEVIGQSVRRWKIPGDDETPNDKFKRLYLNNPLCDCINCSIFLGLIAGTGRLETYLVSFVNFSPLPRLAIKSSVFGIG